MTTTMSIPRLFIYFTKYFHRSSLWMWTMSLSGRPYAIHSLYGSNRASEQPHVHSMLTSGRARLTPSLLTCSNSDYRKDQRFCAQRYHAALVCAREKHLLGGSTAGAGSRKAWGGIFPFQGLNGTNGQTPPRVGYLSGLASSRL